METIDLHFQGPLTFIPGERSLFHCQWASVPCVYLWTIRSERDGQYYVHYIGETLSFAGRQRDHLVQVLGMNYGIFDPSAARRGEAVMTWRGLWRDKSADGPGRLLEHYENHARSVLGYIDAVEVFVGETHVDDQFRKHIEGSIGRHLRSNHKDKMMLYPDDNRTRVSSNRGQRLKITADVPIAGVIGELDV